MSHGGYPAGAMHLMTGPERTSWAADRHRERSTRLQARIHLSRLAHETRRPGQTLQARMRELDAETDNWTIVSLGTQFARQDPR